MKVNELITEIKQSITDEAGKIRSAASMKDEERVMREMLNDREYSVGVYTREGKVGEFSPSTAAREMIGSVIAGTVKISQEEASGLAEEYEFKKSEAQAFVDISKEYINTYVQTGRKLPLGGRETFDAALQMKSVEERQTKHPKRIGVDANGKPEFDNVVSTINAHDSIKSKSSCPEWLKK